MRATFCVLTQTPRTLGDDADWCRLPPTANSAEPWDGDCLIPNSANGADCPDAAAESASAGRRNAVVLNYTDGTREIRQGGSRSWRNNNPGNIRPGNLQGEIGNAGGFAVFSRESAGQSAIVELLSRPAYQALTVFGAINRWAPPVENDTAAYQARVQNLTGLDGQTQMSTLTQGQLESVANAIRNVEGWTPGRRTCWRQRAQ